MSGFKEYERYDGLGLAELVRRREVAPRELLEAALARIERIDPKIHAVCGLAVEAAQRALAHRARMNGLARSGGYEASMESAA